MNLKIHEDIPENSRPYRCFMIYPNKSSLRHYNIFLIRIKFIRVHWAQNFLKKKSKLRVRLRIILKVQIRYEKREKSPRVIPEISAIKHGFCIEIILEKRRGRHFASLPDERKGTILRIV